MILQHLSMKHCGNHERRRSRYVSWPCLHFRNRNAQTFYSGLGVTIAQRVVDFPWAGHLLSLLSDQLLLSLGSCAPCRRVVAIVSSKRYCRGLGQAAAVGLIHTSTLLPNCLCNVEFQRSEARLTGFGKWNFCKPFNTANKVECSSCEDVLEMGLGQTNVTCLS